MNPYLMLAAVLGGALTGLEDAAEPPAPITGNAWEQDVEHLPTSWSEAIDLFQNSPRTARIFGDTLIGNLVATKRQELRHFEALSAEEKLDLYLDTV